MALAADSGIYNFGTQVVLFNSATSVLVASGLYSGASAVTAVGDSESASIAKFVYNGPLDIAPDAQDCVHLFERARNIDGAGNHANVPSDTYPDKYLGSFLLDDSAATPQSGVLMASIQPEAEYYIQAGTVTANILAGYELLMYPAAIQPK